MNLRAFSNLLSVSGSTMRPDLAALKKGRLVSSRGKIFTFLPTLRKISGTWASNLRLSPSLTPKNLMSQLKWGSVHHTFNGLYDVSVFQHKGLVLLIPCKYPQLGHAPLDSKA